MQLSESLRMAWRSIRSHRLRSTLTTIGVIIGIAAVIVFVTLGASLQADIIGEVAGDQEPTMSVWAGPDVEAGPGAGAQPVFTQRDIRGINDTAGVNRTLPRGSVGSATMTRGNDTIVWEQLVAVPPDYFEGTNFTAGGPYRSGNPEIVVNEAGAALFNGSGAANGSNASGSGANGSGGLPGNVSIGQLRNASPSELRNLSGNLNASRLLGTPSANTSTDATAAANATASTAPSTGGTTTIGAANETDRTTGGNLSVGDSVRVTIGDRTIDATVAGILNGTPGNAFEGFGGGPSFYVPTDPFYNTTAVVPGTEGPQRVYPLVTVRADGFGQVTPTRERVLSYLRNDSLARTLKPDSYVFQVQTNEQLLDRLQDLLSTLTQFIVAVAAISLLVGSIGIANIMLVSVTERTREIGIMKATGAKRRDILQLFLVEAVLLGVIGSVLGATVGAIGAYAATSYVELPLVLEPWLFAGAIAVGIGVGVIAGVYPAWQAARTDPIDALRYE